MKSNREVWQRITKKLQWYKDYNGHRDYDDPKAEKERVPTEKRSEAKLYGSKVVKQFSTDTDTHIVAVDIDWPAALVPSSQEGHYHLFIDHELTTGQYERLLTVMAEVGIISEGYLKSFQIRGSTDLRTPWEYKENHEPGVERQFLGHEYLEAVVDEEWREDVRNRHSAEPLPF